MNTESINNKQLMLEKMQTTHKSVWSISVQTAKKYWLFAIIVVLPTLLAIIYYGLVASDVYVSEASFIVRSPQLQSSNGLSALLQNTGVAAFDKAPDDVYAVSDFVLSRDALRQIDKKVDFRGAMSDSSIDMLSRFNPFGWRSSFEDLYRYYGNHVTVDVDSSSSISTLTIRAFSAKEAQAIAEQLMETAERRVNELNTRARNDLIHVAQAEVDEAGAGAKQATLALANYRNSHVVIDPEQQGKLQLEQVAAIQQQLIATQTQLSQLRTFTPKNPQIAATELREKNLQEQMDALTSKVAGERTSLASKSVEYEWLNLARDFAEKRLAAATAALVQARMDALRKQLYLERVVEPNLPDYAMEPRRLRAVLIVLGFGLILWSMLKLLIAGVREHQD
jgi:capsular polysaccharide transport system permease protein